MVSASFWLLQHFVIGYAACCDNTLESALVLSGCRELWDLNSRCLRCKRLVGLSLTSPLVPLSGCPLPLFSNISAYFQHEELNPNLDSTLSMNYLLEFRSTLFLSLVHAHKIKEWFKLAAASS